MQELFWFFLGGFVYLMVDKSISFYKKVKFLNDIKFLSFNLIGYAYQQWATITAAKYIYLEAFPFMEKYKYAGPLCLLLIERYQHLSIERRDCTYLI